MKLTRYLEDKVVNWMLTEANTHEQLEVRELVAILKSVRREGKQRYKNCQHKRISFATCVNWEKITN
jgi:hypothetical protein